MLQSFADFRMSEDLLSRFVEARLHCGVMARRFGVDEMVWSRGIFALLDLDPETEKASFTLLQSMKHPEDRLTFAQVESKYVGLDNLNRTYRVIRRDGTMRVLSQHAEILFDATGKPDRFLSVVSDVTEFEKLRQRAQVTTRRLDAFARHAGILISLTRPDGYITRVIASDIESESEQKRRIGFQWRELIHPDDRDTSVFLLEKAAKEKVALVREHRVLQNDGKYRWRRAKWFPVLDGKQDLAEFICLTEDIEHEKCVVTAKDATRPITGAQLRAGRALARWSVQQLSDFSCVSPSVIRRLEEYDGVSQSAHDALLAIRDSLGRTGVEFIFPATGNPGVRLA